MTKVPYAWQLEAVARAAGKEIISLAVDCSCGKTLAAILIALKKRMPTIVIAPTLELCKQWREDIIADAGEEADVWLYNRSEEVKQGSTYRERFIEWLKA